MKFGWKTRVGIVLSAIWLCVLFVFNDHHTSNLSVLAFGILPLLVIWGIVWAVAGWRAQRTPKNPKSEADIQAARQKRIARLMAFVGFLLILILGWISASVQLKPDHDDPSQLISSWFGEFLAYSLVVYIVARAIPKISPAMVAGIVALFIAGGINYKAFKSEEAVREVKASLTRAAPLFAKATLDGEISEQEVKNANIGIFEPIMLVQASFSHDLKTLTDNYQKSVNDFHFETALSPKSLTNQAARDQTRITLSLWKQATEQYKTQIDSVIAAHRLKMAGAVNQTPYTSMKSALTSFDRSTTKISAYAREIVALENEGADRMLHMVILMDSDPSGYEYVKGPPQNIMFNKPWMLSRYQTLVTELTAVNDKEEKRRNDYLKERVSAMDDLRGLITN